MGKVYTRFQTKTAQNPHPMGRHILGLHQGVTPPPLPSLGRGMTFRIDTTVSLKFRLIHMHVYT